MLSGRCEQAGSVLRENQASTGHGKSQHRTSRDGNESKENPVFNNVSIDTSGVFGSAMWSHEALFQQHQNALEKSSGNHGEAFPHSPHA